MFGTYGTETGGDSPATVSSNGNGNGSSAGNSPAANADNNTNISNNTTNNIREEGDHTFHVNRNRRRLDSGAEGVLDEENGEDVYHVSEHVFLDQGLEELKGQKQGQGNGINSNHRNSGNSPKNQRSPWKEGDFDALNISAGSEGTEDMFEEEEEKEEEEEEIEEGYVHTQQRDSADDFGVE